MGYEGNEGIIPRLCSALFDRIANKSSLDWQAKVEVSYMEIYNEKVHDLLDPMSSTSNKQGLKVREHNVLGKKSNKIFSKQSEYLSKVESKG